MKTPKTTEADLRRKVEALRSRLATCSIHDFAKVETAYNVARMELEYFETMKSFPAKET